MKAALALRSCCSRGSHCFPSYLPSCDNSRGGAFENQVCLVEAVKHRLAVRLERRSEQVVQVSLVVEVDPRNGYGATIAGLARASRGASLFIGAGCINGHGNGALDFGLLF